MMGHWFQDVCQLAEAAFSSYGPWMAAILDFFIKSTPFHNKSEIDVLKSYWCHFLYCRERSYISSYISWCLQVENSLFWELLPLNRVHFGFLIKIILSPNKTKENVFMIFWGLILCFLKGSYNTLSISQCYLVDGFRFWQLRPLNGGHLGFFYKMAF